MAALTEKLVETNKMIKMSDETAKKIVRTTDNIGENLRGANFFLEVAKG